MKEIESPNLGYGNIFISHSILKISISRIDANLLVNPEQFYAGCEFRENEFANDYW